MPFGRGCCPTKTGSHGRARPPCKRPGSEVNAFPPPKKRNNCKKVNSFRFREFPFSIQIVLKKERVTDPSHLLSEIDRYVGDTLVAAKLFLSMKSFSDLYSCILSDIYCVWKTNQMRHPVRPERAPPFFGLPQMGVRVCVARGAFYLSPPPGFLRSNWPSLSLSLYSKGRKLTGQKAVFIARVRICTGETKVGHSEIETEEKPKRLISSANNAVDMDQTGFELSGVSLAVNHKSPDWMHTLHTLHGHGALAAREGLQCAGANVFRLPACQFGSKSVPGEELIPNSFTYVLLVSKK